MGRRRIVINTFGYQFKNSGGIDYALLGPKGIEKIMIEARKQNEIMYPGSTKKTEPKRKSGKKNARKNDGKKGSLNNG